jgi:hypothetical protein
MKICVVGWYYRHSFYRKLSLSHYDAFVIKHREGNTQDVPGMLYENKGLEFGAYQQYVDNHWDGESDVFFCHDDAEIRGLNALEQVDSLANMEVDHAYVFNNMYEEWANNGHHGRGMWGRASWLAGLKGNGGFHADMENEGNIETQKANKGIQQFHEHCIVGHGSKVGVSAIVQGIEFARRGWIADQMYCFKRTENCILTPVI